MMKNFAAYPLIAALLSAQDVLHVKRLPPANEYRKSSEVLAGTVPPANTADVIPPNGAAAPVAAPPGYKANRDVPLDDNAQKALAIANEYVHRQTIPVAGKDGTVLYPYGALATIICATFRTCTIELEPDELLKTEQHADRSWDVHPWAQEQNGHLISTVTLVPHRIGSDSSLLLITDRRQYDLRIISKTSEYMPRVAFTYPDDSQEAMQAYRDKVALEMARKKAETVPHEPATKQVEVTYTKGYSLQGKKSFFRHEQHPWFWPLDVRDDGKGIDIELPAATQTVRAPKLMAVGPKGFEPINYDVQGNTYKTRTLFHKAALINGTGRKAQVVYITSPRGETK